MDCIFTQSLVLDFQQQRDKCSLGNPLQLCLNQSPEEPGLAQELYALKMEKNLAIGLSWILDD